MNGFLLECLYPTGWRRTGEIYWRFADANLEVERLLREGMIRAGRILSVTIHPDAVALLDGTSRREGSDDE